MRYEPLDEEGEEMHDSHATPLAAPAADAPDSSLHRQHAQHPPRLEVCMPTSGKELHRIMGSKREDSHYSLLSEGDDAPAVDVDLEVALDLHVRAVVFVEFFALQLLAPLSVPYVVARYGWSAARNMQLLQLLPPVRDNKGACLSLGQFLDRMLIVLCWELLVASLVIYGLREEALLADGISFAELLVAVMMVGVHRIMVAIKYASMSPTELRLFLRARKKAADEYNNRIQLLTGVWNPQREMVFREITRAWRHVISTGAHPHNSACSHTLHYSFAVEPGMEERWERLLLVLGEQSPFAQEPGAPKPQVPAISVGDVLCALVLRSTHDVVTPRYRQFALWTSRGIALLISVLPTALRLLKGQAPFGSDTCSCAFVLCTMVLTFAWSRVNLLFLMMITSNYQRIALERELLSVLITEHDGFIRGDSGDRVSSWPTLNLTNPSAVRVFALLWKLQFAYGRAYRVRMTIFNTLLCGLVLSMALLLGYAIFERERTEQLLELRHAQQLYGAEHAAHVHSGLHLQPGDQRELKNSLPINMMILLSIILAGNLYLQLRAGSQANARVNTLRLHMLAGITSAHTELERLNHREATLTPGTEETAQLLSERHLAQQAIELLQHEVNALSVIADVFPVTLLGLQASMQLAYTVGTSVLTVALILLDIVYGVSLMPYLKALQPGSD
jgi:hypothetical protein